LAQSNKKQSNMSFVHQPESPRAIVIYPFPQNKQRAVILVTENIVFVDMSTTPGICNVIYQNGMGIPFEYDISEAYNLLTIIYTQCIQPIPRIVESTDVESMIKDFSKGLKTNETTSTDVLPHKNDNRRSNNNNASFSDAKQSWNKSPRNNSIYKNQ
jgi:hypothetical protein